MTDFRTTGYRGTKLELYLTCTYSDTGAQVDLTAIGTRLIVTGKLHVDDATALFVKDYYQAGGAPHGGVTPHAAPNTNVATVKLEPADTAALTRTSYVLVDAVLVEPSGDRDVVATGVIKVRVTPGT